MPANKEDTAMGFRFQKRIKIFPGITLNISKSGVSVSGGVRGARVTVGKKGVRRTFGIPGTGVSHTSHTPWGALRSWWRGDKTED